MKSNKTSGTITRKNFRDFLLLLAGAFIISWMMIQRVHAQDMALMNKHQNSNDPAAGIIVPTNHFENGVEAAANKNDAEAIKYFTLALAENVNDDNALHQRGCAYARLKQYKNAIRDFTAAIQADSSISTYYYHRALAENKAGKYIDCIEDCDKVLSMDSLIAEAWLIRGIAKAIKGDEDGSMADFRGALACRPGYAEALYNIGLNYYEANDNDNAGKYLLDAKKAGFSNPELESYLEGIKNVN